VTEKYTYSILDDFPNQQVNLALLTTEIESSSISTALEYVATDEDLDICDIWFESSLSSEDETTLGGVVAEHAGVPCLCLPMSAPGWNLKVEDRDLTDPPASPTGGLYYIVAATATGAWVGQEDKIASWNGTTWQFQKGSVGFAAWIADENAVVVYQDDNDKWQPYGDIRLVPTPVFGSDLHAAQSTFVSTTTSIGWQNKITLVTATLTGGTYRLEVSYGWNHDEVTSDFGACVRQDGSPVGEIHQQEPKDAGGKFGFTGTSQRHVATRIFHLDLSAQSYTFTLDYASEVAWAESSIWDAYMTLWRMS